MNNQHAEQRIMSEGTLSILKKILAGGLFLVPFIPFIVANSLFFPFITGKAFFFRFLVEILLALWAVVAYYDRSYIPRWSWVLSAVVFFVGITGLADALGADPWKSFWSNFERMEGFILILHLFAYFIVITSALRTERLWERFFQASIFASVIMGLYGILQLSGAAVIHQGGVRLDGSFGNSAYLAVYALAHAFFALFFLARATMARMSAGMLWAYGIAAGLNMLVLYYTATRGAILGFLGGILLSAILVAVLARGAEYAVIRKWAAGVLGAVVLVVGAFFALKENPIVRDNQILGRFASISLEETTTLSRFLIWDMAVKGFAERPLLGWGQENFNLVFNKYYDPKMYAQEPWFDRAHNIFFDWLIAGGVLGLLAYLLMFVAVLWVLWKKSTPLSVVEKSILTGFLSAYIFHNMFVFDHLLSYILFFSVAGYAHVVSLGFTPRAVSASAVKKQESHIDIVVAPLIAVLLLVVMYVVNADGLFANKALLQGLRSHPEGAIKNLEYFKKAASYEGLGLAEVREQAAQMAVKVAYMKGVPDEVKIAFISFAGEEIKKHADTHPEDARYQLFAASFLNTVGDYAGAMEYIQRALALSPKKQDIFFELTAIHVNKGEYKEALVAARTLYEYEPKNDEARKLYAIMGMYAKDFKLADEILAPVKDTLTPTDYQRILSAYSVIGRYDKVLEIWQAMVAREPGNTQYRVGLAATYIKTGQRARAVAELREAIAGNPDFAQLGEYYITEIQAGRNP